MIRNRLIDVSTACGATRVLLVDRPPNLTVRNVATVLHDSLRGTVAKADALVLREPLTNPNTVPDSGAATERLAPLIDRFPTLPCYLLEHIGYKHHFSASDSRSFDPLWIEKSPMDDVVGSIRNAELRNFIHPIAFFGEKEGCVYRLPSGVYSNMFLRVGSLFVEPHVSRSCVFWMIPWLEGIASVITDTWSLSSLGLMACLWKDGFNTAGTERMVFHTISEYHDSREAAISSMRTIIEEVEITSAGRSLVLISACMTGRLLAQIKEAIRLAGRSQGKFVYLAVFGLGEEIEIDVLCDLTCGVGEKNTKFKFARSKEQIEAAQKKVIEIDRRTYFPLLMIDKQTFIHRREAGRERSFYDKYVGKDAVSVHRSALIGGRFFRHHAIYVDVVRLLGHRGFRGRLHEILRGLDPKPEMAVIPPHNAGDALAAVVEKVLGLGADRCFRHLTLRRGTDAADDEKLSTLVQAGGPKAMLILDDVAATGARLRTYQRSLRDLGYTGRIYYVVGVARLTSSQERIRLERVLRPNQYGPEHSFQFVEEIILPDWDETDCPWCIEQRFLEECIQNVYTPGQTPVSVLDRRELLQAAPDSGGLGEGIFITPPGEPEVPLGNNSLFVARGAGASMIFAAVAGALQRLRTQSPSDPKMPPRLAPLDYPVVSVLDPNDIGQRYTDAMLRCAYLRAARRDEVEQVSSVREESRIAMMKGILQSGDPQDRGAVGEILFGVALGKIPRNVIDEGVRAFLGVAGYGDILDLVDRVLAVGR